VAAHALVDLASQTASSLIDRRSVANDALKRESESGPEAPQAMWEVAALTASRPAQARRGPAAVKTSGVPRFGL